MYNSLDELFGSGSFYPVAAPHLYRTEAIVLRRADFGEADKILTLYTPHLGKLRVIAKGVRRPTSRLGGHVELFTHSAMLVAKGRNLDIVTQSETIHSFIGLREDLVRTAFSCHVAELTERLVEEGIESYPLFELLLRTFERISSGDDPEIATHFFEVQLLGHLGYRPELRHCCHCQVVVGPTGNFFSPVAGGVLCTDCGRADAMGKGLTTNAFKMLRLMQSGTYATAARVRLDESLRREIDSLLKGYVEYVLERKLKSAALLEALRRTASKANEGNKP